VNCVPSQALGSFQRIQLKGQPGRRALSGVNRAALLRAARAACIEGHRNLHRPPPGSSCNSHAKASRQQVLTGRCSSIWRITESVSVDQHCSNVARGGACLVADSAERQFRTLRTAGACPQWVRSRHSLESTLRPDRQRHPHMKHFPPPRQMSGEPGREGEPARKRLTLQQWLVILATLLSALLVPFLLVMWLERG